MSWRKRRSWRRGNVRLVPDNKPPVVYCVVTRRSAINKILVFPRDTLRAVYQIQNNVRLPQKFTAAIYSYFFYGFGGFPQPCGIDKADRNSIDRNPRFYPVTGSAGDFRNDRTVFF